MKKKKKTPEVPDQAEEAVVQIAKLVDHALNQGKQPEDPIPGYFVLCIEKNGGNYSTQAATNVPQPELVVILQNILDNWTEPAPAIIQAR